VHPRAGLLAAAVFAGMFTGGLMFGSLSDQIGRRKSLLYSLLLNGFFGLMSALSPNVYALITFRSCAGIGWCSFCWVRFMGF
jgi:MFS family permease